MHSGGNSCTAVQLSAPQLLDATPTVGPSFHSHSKGRDNTTDKQQQPDIHSGKGHAREHSIPYPSEDPRVDFQAGQMGPQEELGGEHGPGGTAVCDVPAFCETHAQGEFLGRYLQASRLAWDLQSLARTVQQESATTRRKLSIVTRSSSTTTRREILHCHSFFMHHLGALFLL